MRVSKNEKIAILVIIMLITAYPAFMAVEMWSFFTQEPDMWGGYYLLPILTVCAIAFVVSLAWLIKIGYDY